MGVVAFIPAMHYALWYEFEKKGYEVGGIDSDFGENVCLRRRCEQKNRRGVWRYDFLVEWLSIPGNDIKGTYLRELR